MIESISQYPDRRYCYIHKTIARWLMNIALMCISRDFLFRSHIEFPSGINSCTLDASRGYQIMPRH